MDPRIEAALPRQRSLYYGGQWHEPAGGWSETFNPATGESLGRCADANAADVDAATRAAREAFESWRRVKPLERGALLKKVARVLRDNAAELAVLDAANCGNPIKAVSGDALNAASQLEYFAGLANEAKGHTMPMGEGVINMTVRQPYGVCARIAAYNHPLLFIAGKLGALLVTGNTAVVKPPHQAPLSSYRLMELLDGVLPPGVVNVVTGGAECGRAIVEHPLIPHVALIGSVPTGRAIARSAADRLKHVSLELGGKNAFIVYPDANLAAAARGAVDGMNFTWCGQSCGSTSRLFLHESVYDEVLEGVLQRIRKHRPGDPLDPATTMGALISKAQYDKVLDYIDIATKEGARLLCGGKRSADPALAKGFFIEPTVFGDVTQGMRIASEEVFGPVLSVLKWRDEEELFAQVNAVEYGLTCAIYTSNLATAHRAADRVEAGFVWVNNASQHFLGAPFGGFKQSGIGREESIEQLFEYTQLKNVNITLNPQA